MADESKKRQAEISALLEGSQAVLRHRRFEATARAIFETCKKLIEASAGYVALLSEDGTRNDVLFLDSGGLECTVDPSLPMPIRGLRGEAYRMGKAAYDNDFSKSDWVRFMPSGHMALRSVLFAPLNMNGKAVGLIGLANKAGGFNENDARLASAFGDFLAISLMLSKAMDALEESEKKYRLLVENLHEGIWVIDKDAFTIFANPRMAEMLGYTVDEMMGKHIFEFMDEKGVESAKENLDWRRRGGVRKQYDFEFVRKDGTKIFTTLETSPVTDVNGNYLGALAGVIDITEKKRMEEELRDYTERLEEMVEEKTKQLVNAEKFAAAGKVASMVAHDLRGPLLSIRQAANFIRKDPSKTDRMLDIVERNADKGILMIEELRNQTRDLPLKIENVDLSLLIRQTVEEASIPNSIKVSIESKADLVVPLDQMKIRRLLDNLVRNAVDAMPEGGSLTISAIKESSHIIVTISDTGTGIPKEELTKMFQPFYTTKSGGLGLGLPYCKRVVEAHCGSIKLESKVGEGTSIVISLPLNHA